MGEGQLMRSDGRDQDTGTSVFFYCISVTYFVTLAAVELECRLCRFIPTTSRALFYLSLLLLLHYTVLLLVFIIILLFLFPGPDYDLWGSRPWLLR